MHHSGTPKFRGSNLRGLCSVVLSVRIVVFLRGRLESPYFWKVPCTHPEGPEYKNHLLGVHTKVIFRNLLYIWVEGLGFRACGFSFLYLAFREMAVHSGPAGIGSCKKMKTLSLIRRKSSLHARIQGLYRLYVEGQILK